MKTGFFGKLPIHADFLKWNASSPEFQLLDQWIQKGIYQANQKWGTKWTEKFDTLPSFNFLFQPENQKRIVAGMFSPGQDKGGRRYPFIIFTEETQLPFPTLPDFLVLNEKKFLADANLYLEKEWENLDAVAFSNKFKAWVPQNQADSLDLSGITTSTLWEGIFGSADHRQKALLIQNIIDTFAPFRKIKPASAFPGVRIPLSSNGKSSLQVLFWLRLILKIVPLNIAPSLFWKNAPEKEENPFLYLYLKAPNSKNFLSFLEPKESFDGVPGNLAELRLPKIDDVLKKVSPTVQTLLNQDIPLSEFLTKFQTP